MVASGNNMYLTPECLERDRNADYVVTLSLNVKRRPVEYLK